MSIFDNVAAGLRLTGTRERRPARAGPPLAAGGRSVGRGQEPPERARDRALRRPAAAAVHRPDGRGRARGDPDGRAVLGARSDRDAEGRGADRRAQGALHDRDRHPQHAAGGARRQLDRVHARRRGDRARADERRSSPTQRTSAPSATSPGSSGKGPVGSMQETRHQFREDLKRARAPGAGRPRPGDRAARPRAGVDQLPGRRAGRRWSSPTTTGSTAATWRSTRGSCRCWPARRRWPAICGSSPRCCT